MNELIALGGTITLSQIIISIAALVFVGKILMSVYYFIINRYTNIQKDVKLSETVNQLSAEITNLSNIIDEQIKLTQKLNDETDRKIDELSDILDIKLKQINTKINENQEESKEYRRASMHDKIIQMHNKFMNDGFVSHSNLENFSIVLSQYYKAGGNGLIKSRYEPEIMALRLED